LDQAVKWVRNFACASIVVAVCSTVWFVSALKPVSSDAFVSLTLWLVVPYAVMIAALTFLHRKRGTSSAGFVAAIVVSAGGILALTDVIYWHPDAQGAIAVLMIPILQLGALAVFLPVAWWMSRGLRT
jgi:cytochrome bd-type quinol oxidase subunit 2